MFVSPSLGNSFCILCVKYPTGNTALNLNDTESSRTCINASLSRTSNNEIFLPMPWISIPDRLNYLRLHQDLLYNALELRRVTARSFFTHTDRKKSHWSPVF